LADKKLRIHTLAKEIGVDSKVIIEKCRAEEIDVKNHMHVVGPGLEATIREWFTVGVHATAVEQAAPVDVETARAKSRKRKPTKAEQAAAAATADSDNDASSQGDEPVTIPSEPPIPEISEQKPPPSVAAEAPELTIVENEPVTDTTDADAGAPLAPEAQESVPDSTAAAARAAEPPPPAKAPIAGPQNVPQPAKLSGPRVVRIERPDTISRPPPRAPRPAGRPPIGPGGPPRREEDDGRPRRMHGKVGERAGGGTGGEEGPAADRKRAHPRRGVRDINELVSEHMREWRDRDLIERRDRLAHTSGRGIAGLRAVENRPQRGKGGQQRFVAERKSEVTMSEPITITEFSRETGIPWLDVQRKLLQEYGTMVNRTSVLEKDVAMIIAEEHGITLEVVPQKTGLDKLQDEYNAIPRKHLATRPPIVTVLGHVDHGKTSLLDRIRDAKVAAGEAGGITQHIGAYRVQVGDRWVTFLDTPGHTAFTAMRARGANMTDVVVLVVAADDGVMPTTVEAIHHAKAANATIVVALNKIDLPHDINKIYGQLAEHGLNPSEWGGETDVVKTSATQGTGIDELLAHLATLSDVLDLKADPTIPGSGTVVEAHKGEGVGIVARLMVQEGTLKPGQQIVCGQGHGKVRSMRDEHGRAVNKAGPSTPVEVTGLNAIPTAGDKFYTVENAQRAKEIASELAIQLRERGLTKLVKPTTLEAMLANAAVGTVPELRIILRADMQGSIDVLKKTLGDFPTNQVKLVILHDGVGTVTESDVVLAQASEAMIVAFHVVPDPAISRLADDANVSIRTYRVIYNLLDDIKKALEDQLEPEEKIESRGRAEVREIFSVSKVGKIAGCMVREGSIARNHTVRVVRDGVVVKDRAGISSLRRFKDDAKEVKAGLECGINVEGFSDVKPGDIIESYEVIKIARTLDEPVKVGAR